MFALQRIKESYGLEDCVISGIDLKDDVLSVIVPQIDGDIWSMPAAIMVNEKLLVDTDYQESVWEALSDTKDDLIKQGCSTFDAVVIYSILEILYGHSDPLNNYTITLQRLNSYTGQCLSRFVTCEYYRVSLDGKTDVELKAEEILAETE